MKIKELTYQEYLKYYDAINENLVAGHQQEFKVSKENAQEIINQKLEALKEFIKIGNAFLIAAIEDDQLIGFIWIYHHQYFDEKRLHINELMVDEKQRKRGIGKLLLAEAEKKAKSLDIRVLDLVVSEDNSIAQRVYGKLGYQTERRKLIKKL